LDDAPLINAAIDIHPDYPEFGYCFIADELGRRHGESRAGRVAGTTERALLQARWTAGI
jgi:hypothetical protein